MKPDRNTRKRRSSFGSSRRRALVAYLLLGVIAVLLAVTLMLFPRPSGEPSPAETAAEAEDDRTDRGTGEPEDTVSPEAGKQMPAEDSEGDDAGRSTAEDGESASVSEPTLYLVIDDVGYDRSLLEPFLSLQIPITFAVLPKLPDSRAAARMIDKSGQEYILHQPMEAAGGEDPGPGVITDKMEPKHIREVVHTNLKGLPKAKGVNNHMGSKGTSEKEVMAPLFEELKHRNLFFLDSRTTVKTIGSEEAERSGVPFSARNVFLDNEDDREYIEKALEESWELASRRGEAVMIGHIWSEQLPAVLREWIPRVRERGGTFRFLSHSFEKE